MIDVYKEHLFYENKLSATTFRYDNLNIESDTIVYGNIHAKYIVFAEGFGLKNNPFFKDLPLTGTKGEVLIIDAPDLNIGFILKSSIFIIPLGNSLFYIGATYEHTDKSYTASEDAKLELLKKLKNVIRCKFTIVEQKAGIRPTTRDRRPLVGRHDQLKNLCVLNGLGTRGIMIAPYISNALYNHLENDEDLNPDIDISRFK